jgi:putative redox protein
MTASAKSSRSAARQTTLSMSASASLRDKIAALIATIEKDPVRARVTFRASSQLEDGLRCSAWARNLPPIIIDEPHKIGGTDLGMNPVELLLCAMGACQEIMYAVYASLMGIQLDEVKVSCRATLDLRGLLGIRDVPPGLFEVEFETHIRSSASRESVARLIDRAEHNCPIMDTVTRPTRSVGKAYLNGEEIHVRDSIRADDSSGSH